MSAAVAIPNDTATFVCPQCGTETTLHGRPGHQVVAAYCLHQQGSGDGAGGTQAVRMERQEAQQPTLESADTL